MSASLYILVWLGTLADQLGDVRAAGNAAGIFLLLFLLAEFPRQRHYARVVFLVLPALLARRLNRFHRRVPTFRAEAAVLGASGFVGVALGGLLPAGGLTAVLALLPPVLIPLLVPVLLIATGQLGLNPIAVITVLGAALPAPEALGIAPAVLAFACMLSWGLAVGMTPMSASAIATARWAGTDPWTISTLWNGRYTAFSLLLAWASILAMHLAWR